VHSSDNCHLETELCVHCSNTAASGQRSSGAGGALDCSESSKESSIAGGLSSWAHHSTPQMSAATKPASTDGPRPMYADRRLLQLRTADDDKDAMHRFK